MNDDLEQLREKLADLDARLSRLEKIKNEKRLKKYVS
jgi:hypothetical protein